MDAMAAWIIGAAALLLGAAAGVWGYAAHQRRKEQAKRRIPRKWPLAVRALVNSREKLVWRWLMRVFVDHHVLVKLPVTRFTMPQVREEGPHWFQLLSGVYCTFTVCTPEGHVIGCVDVPGPRGLSLSNQTLKHTLLTQCNIRYWVVDPENLPHTTSIRAAFLGEQAVIQENLERMRSAAQFNQSRANLKAALSRQRHAHPSDFGRLDSVVVTDAPGHEALDSQLSTGWRHDSFVAPLDSRAGELRR